MESKKSAIDKEVEISISGERGYVKGLAQFKSGEDQALVVYKAADGRAAEQWFPLSELQLLD